MKNILKIIFILACTTIVTIQQMQIFRFQAKVENLVEMIEYVNEMEINNSERIYYIEERMETEYCKD